MNTKLVIFDLDNTLVITRPAAKHAYKQAINYLAKLEGRSKDNKKLYNHWKKIVQRVIGEKKPQLRQFSHSLQVLIDEQKMSTSHYQGALHEFEREFLSKLQPQQGARELFSWLKKIGVTIAVATESGTSEAKKKLKHARLYPLVDILVTSNDVGVFKPDPAYYEHCMSHAGVDASEVLVVGDRETEDLEPARQLGCRTYLVTDANHHLGLIKDELSTEEL